MITTLNINLYLVALLLLLAAYTWNLVRSNRINTQWGVGWLMVEGLLVLLCLFRGDLTDAILAPVGDGDVALGGSWLALAWLALLIINNHVRVSKLTVTVKRLDQELALVCERLDRIESPHAQAAPAAEQRGAAPVLVQADPMPAQPPLWQTLIAFLWIAGVFYMFAVYSGLIPPEGRVGGKLSALFASLQAEYLH